MTEFITIAGHDLPVVAQKHARLRHHLSGQDFQKILTKDYAHESYRVLCILIPALRPAIPEHEWEGFTTAEAWEAYKSGDREAYIEAEDSSPTPDEIIGAMEKSLQVNGAGRLGKLLSLIQSGATLVTAQQTVPSPALPGSNGVSTTEPTGTPAQT